MKTQEQMLAALERWLVLEDRWQRAVLTPVADWPRRISLSAPRIEAVEADFPAAMDWVHSWWDWADAHGVDLEVAVRRVFGTSQKLPTHLKLPDVDTAVRLIGGEWPYRIGTARVRSAIVGSRFPETELAPLLRELTALADVDFDLLLTAADWFRHHDATGMTPRQVPVEGLDGKWLNTRQHLVQALSGKHELGLVRRPRTVHFAYLDSKHLEGGRRYDAVTEGDSAAPCYAPRTIVITENKDTALFFPPLEGGIAIQGAGAAGPVTVPHLEWVTECSSVIYWGDLDAEGFEIVHQYRSRGLDVRTILMNCSTLREYGRFGVREDRHGKSLLRARKFLPLLTAEENAAYETVTDAQQGGPFRLEQERIPLDVAHALVLEASRGGGLSPFLASGVLPE
jgi:hypothetical protein